MLQHPGLPQNFEQPFTSPLPFLACLRRKVGVFLTFSKRWSRNCKVVGNCNEAIVLAVKMRAVSVAVQGKINCTCSVMPRMCFHVWMKPGLVYGQMPSGDSASPGSFADASLIFSVAPVLFGRNKSGCL
ncbi:unnamed protein product [Durusdinium trenchii]|uniref:Uncharacterized protein n=1 Tax=Durusdinium trenchii TaxID=1381693 RepID=A0ABP0KMF2_9DINO